MLVASWELLVGNCQFVLQDGGCKLRVYSLVGHCQLRVACEWLPVGSCKLAIACLELQVGCCQFWVASG